MINELKRQLEKNYPDYTFKIVVNNKEVEIFHNRVDKIGDIQFIENILDIYYDIYMMKHNNEVKEDELPQVTVVYDFLNEIKSQQNGVVIEIKIEVQNIKKVLSKGKIELKGVTFFDDFSDERQIILSYVSRNTNKKSTFNKKWIQDFESKYECLDLEHEYYQGNEKFNVDFRNLQLLI